MLNIGPEKLLVIFAVALIVFGPERLPEVARQIGRAMRTIRQVSAGFEAQLREAIELPPEVEPTDPRPARPVREHPLRAAPDPSDGVGQS